MDIQTEKVPLEEAARRLQTTPLNILMHIKRGLLRGEEKDDLWEIDAASLAALQEKTGGGKAADVCASGCSKRHNCSSCS